jgi:hypothetical protein
VNTANIQVYYGLYTRTHVQLRKKFLRITPTVHREHKRHNLKFKYPVKYKTVKNAATENIYKGDNNLYVANWPQSIQIKPS